VTAAGFAEIDAVDIVAALRGEQKGRAERREAQDMTAWPYYLSESDWADASEGVEAAMQVCINVLIYRFGCVNACEQTLKRIAAGSLALHSTHVIAIPELWKSSMLASVKKKYRKVQRSVKDAQRKKPTCPKLPYITSLPLKPDELLRKYPSFAEQFKVEGCWTKPKFDVHALQLVEGSMACRGAIAGRADTAAQLMHMMMYMREGFQRQLPSENDGDIPITYNPGIPPALLIGYGWIPNFVIAIAKASWDHQACRPTFPYGIPNLL
jgi:hypothetical protein